MSWSAPPGGSLIYNGFRFPPGTKTVGQIQPVYDTTGRFVKYVRYSLRVETIVFSGADDYGGSTEFGSYSSLFPTPVDAAANGADPIDLGIGALRKVLSEPGRTLVVVDRGLGIDFVVSGQPGVTVHMDLDFGPKPSVVAWEPIAGNKAVRLVWEVETTISECAENPYVMGAELRRIVELNWASNVSIDQYGLTTRTIEGQLELAVARVGAFMQGSASDQRGAFVPPVPDGFQRVAQQHQLSPDRKLLRFSFTDKEHPSENPLPEAVVDCDVDYSIESTGNVLVGNQWRCTLSGSISVAKGQPRWKAWVAFLQVVESKLASASNAKIATAKGETIPPFGNSKQTIVFNRLALTEQVFGRGMSFSLSWTLYTEIGSLFDASGIWKQLSGTSWGLYRASMTGEGGAWTIGGAAQLQDLTQDAIISLCDLTRPLPGLTTVNQRRFGVAKPLFATQIPPAEESWLAFNAWVELEEDTRQITHYSLSGPPISISQAPYGRGSQGSGIESTSAAGGLITQSMSQPYYRAVFKGYAVRLGHKIPVPRLKSYGGAEAVPIGKARFIQKESKRGLGCVLYVASWEQEYSLAKAPTGELMVSDPDLRQFPK